MPAADPPDVAAKAPAAEALDGLPGSVEALRERLAAARYFTGPELATAIYLALHLRRPLFLEGEAGVGKTEVAKVLARLLERPLIRLQCYEGLDAAHAVYEWDYTRQLLQVRLLEAAGGVDLKSARKDLYSEDFLLKRPLLQALESSKEGHPPVLLIDELDRADEEFEAYLLEILSDFQITIPELGTLKARQPPIVILTSNRTREIRDALRRRCLYAWIDYPTFERELEIVRARAAEVGEELAREAVAFVQALRHEELYKAPGVAETLDWIRALHALATEHLDPQVVEATLGVLLKYQDDLERVREVGVAGLVARGAS